MGLSMKADAGRVIIPSTEDAGVSPAAQNRRDRGLCLPGRNVAAGIDMAKKKARRQKPKGPQTPRLEDLLRAGESALYGQVCWSIANRGTEHTQGRAEVITLQGGDEAGESSRE